MKRFTILLAVLLVAASSAAQVRVMKNDHPLQKVAALTQVSMLALRDSTYYLIFVTDNNYDDPVIIKLGEGKAAAFESLDTLDDMMDGIARDETFYLDDEAGVSFFVSRIPLTKHASLASKTRAGKATLHRTVPKRAREALLE